MLNSLKNLTAFRLSDLAEFPYTDYQENLEKYLEYESWYTGEALDEQQSQADKDMDIYPLHLNPIRGACLKHAYALWGEFPDDISAWLAGIKAIIKDESDRKKSNVVEEILFDTWHNNNGASLMMENSIISQIYGGCIFKASYVSEPDGEKRIRIEAIHPKEFVGIPYSTNPWRLRKAWVVREIDEEDAAEFGVVVNSKAYYIEFWTEHEYQILINDTPIVYNEQYADIIYGGDNPFGFVPFVYIPHQRAGSFYGDSLVSTAAIGITKEKNLRTADAGDAVSDESHSILAMRNVRGVPPIVLLGNRVPVVNLGNNQSVSGSTDEPDLMAVNRSSVSQPMLQLTQELQNELRRELMVPAVAEGEDEGSQRSAATLSARMWPLVSHIKSERAMWTTGLLTLNNMILKMMLKKSMNKVSKEHLDVKLKVKWYPILPRDQQAFMEEMVARAGVNLGSLEHLLGMIGDVDDIELVMGQIKDWIEFEAEAKSKSVPAIGAQGDGSQSQAGRPGEALSNGRRKIPSSNAGSGNLSTKTEGSRKE